MPCPLFTIIFASILVATVGLFPQRRKSTETFNFFSDKSTCGVWMYFVLLWAMSIKRREQDRGRQKKFIHLSGISLFGQGSYSPPQHFSADFLSCCLYHYDQLMGSGVTFHIRTCLCIPLRGRPYLQHFLKIKKMKVCPWIVVLWQFNAFFTRTISREIERNHSRNKKLEVQRPNVVSNVSAVSKQQHTIFPNHKTSM